MGIKIQLPVTVQFDGSSRNELSGVVDVELSAEEVKEMWIIDGIDPGTEHLALYMANQCLVAMRSISDEIITKINPAAKKIIRDVLIEQAARYV